MQQFIGDFARVHQAISNGLILRMKGQGGTVLYAKAISMVQSSGTGELHMLTEVCTCFGWQCYATSFR